MRWDDGGEVRHVTSQDGVREEQRLVESLGDACLVVDPDGTILAANEIAGELYERAADDLAGLSIAALCSPEEVEGVLAEIHVCNGRPRSFRALQHKATGGSFVGDFSAKSQHHAGSASILLVVRDAGGLERPLVHDLTLRTMMLDHVSDGLVCHTLDGQLLFANRAALDSWGLHTMKEARALGPFGWVAEEAREQLASLMERMEQDGELRFESHGHSPTGKPLDLEIDSTVINGPDGVFVVSATRDISERMATEEMVRYLAYHDTLTGLANRVLLESDLEHAIAIAKRENDSIGVVFMDLDGFKPVNDTYGHSVGDGVLREVANRLAECLREGDTIARPGGDEFVVVIPRLKDRQGLATIARKLVERIAEPMSIDGIDVQVSASVGLAIHHPGENAEDLITRADLAMYGSRYLHRPGWETFVEDPPKRDV